MKLLITGATGYVGSAVTKKLIEIKNFDIAILTRSKKINGVTNIITENFDRMSQQIEKFSPEAVLHLASYLSSSDDKDTAEKLIDSNINFTNSLLLALKSCKVKYFINTGTFSSYYYNDSQEMPAYLYAATKLAAANIIKYYSFLMDFKYCTVAPYTIYGGTSEQDKIMDIILNSLSSPTSIDMTEGEQVLDFIHIDDVVEFYVKLLKAPDKMEHQQTYHLGFGQGTSIREISQLMEKFSGRKCKINWGVKDYRPLDVMRAIAPICRLTKDFEWKPKTKIYDGVLRIVEGKFSD